MKTKKIKHTGEDMCNNFVIRWNNVIITDIFRVVRRVEIML